MEVNTLFLLQLCQDTITEIKAGIKNLKAASIPLADALQHSEPLESSFSLNACILA